jgi:8-oxo-dGTP diphosphatase
MDRKSKDTKFGVHVKALVFNANDEVLVLKTKEGQWDLPGGAVQFGENVYNAVWRTIKDTTDLDADILKPSDVWTLKNTEYLHTVCITFACSWVDSGDDEDPIFLSQSYDEFQWVPQETLLEENYPVWMKNEIKKWNG